MSSVVETGTSTGHRRKELGVWKFNPWIDHSFVKDNITVLYCASLYIYLHLLYLHSFLNVCIFVYIYIRYIYICIFDIMKKSRDRVVSFENIQVFQ